MTDEERFDRLTDAIERVADASASGIRGLQEGLHTLTQAQLGTQQQLGLMATEILRLGQRVDQVSAQVEQVVARVDQLSAQQAAMQQRQAEQDQRFDVLLGEIRHIVQRLDQGSNL